MDARRVCSACTDSDRRRRAMNKQSSTVQDSAPTNDNSRALANPCWSRIQRNNAPDPDHVDKNTFFAWSHALALLGYIEQQKGTFVRDTGGNIMLRLQGKT